MKFKEAFKKLYEDAKEQYNIQQAPKLILRQDEENAKKIFGRTAYYDPGNQEIVVFITNRHPKDILRSYCHELIHHVQNERGDLKMGNTSPTYAQDDDHLRKMEMEAYLKGNLLLRDFEDNFKYQ
jgi:Zn-dependent peptidase ImmA (M78 family)